MPDQDKEQFIPQPAGKISTLKSSTVRHTHSGADSPQIEFNDLGGVIYSVVAYDPVELQGAGSAETKDLTAKGARIGDFTWTAPPYDLQGITHTSYVSGNGTVTVQLVNSSGSTIDLELGNWNIKVVSTGTATI